MEHPNEVLPNIINDSWIQEFIQEHRIPDMRISCYRDPATLFVKVAIELWMSRESEFVLRLQHSNSLPHR
jgi:hypothetical protein